MKEGLAENKVLILYLLNKLQDGIKSDNLYKIVSSANNMNYSDLATALDVRISTISMWKSKKSLPRMETLDKIADLFHITVSDLTTDVSYDKNGRKTHTIYVDTKGMENHPFNILQEKVKNEEHLTDEESIQLNNYLKEAVVSISSSVKKFGERLEKHYEALNEDGQKKADEQLNQALENIEMLTQIPKYQINLAELFAGPNPLKDMPLSSTIEMITDDDKKEED